MNVFTCMNIFQDIHFYLVLSFTIMVIVLYKKVYKNIDNNLTTSISDIKNEITNLRNTRDELQDKVLKLKEEVKTSSVNYQETLQQAKLNLQNVIDEYNNQYAIELEKLKHIKQSIYKNFEIESNMKINKKLKELIIHGVITKINNVSNPTQFNLINLQKSLNMLGNILDQEKIH